MRIIHGKGYSKQDCLEYKNLVFRNILMSMHSLVQAMTELKIVYTDPDAERHVQLLRALTPESGKNMYLNGLTYVCGCTEMPICTSMETHT